MSPLPAIRRGLIAYMAELDASKALGAHGEQSSAIVTRERLPHVDLWLVASAMRDAALDAAPHRLVGVMR